MYSLLEILNIQHGTTPFCKNTGSRPYKDVLERFVILRASKPTIKTSTLSRHTQMEHFQVEEYVSFSTFLCNLQVGILLIGTL